MCIALSCATSVSYIAEKDINFSSKIASGIFKKKIEEEKV